MTKTSSIDYRYAIREIFSLSKDIRYVGIFYKGFAITKMRDGLQNLLTPEETKNSLIDSLTRWKTRRSLSDKLGKPLYAMAEYEKVKRITIPISDDGIMLVSTDTKLYHELIVKEILEIIKRYFQTKRGFD